jgi:phosphopantothenoylcysteine synthetase/decarboxylase
MRAIITCGPSYEPIDDVRRITNFSTGELGVRLANELIRAGFEVTCLKGAAATYAGPLEKGQFGMFNTNDDLRGWLHKLSAGQDVAAVFHTAALCDFKVKSVSDADGGEIHSAKIPSRSGSLTIHLEPATKVSRICGVCFPGARLSAGNMNWPARARMRWPPPGVRFARITRMPVCSTALLTVPGSPFARTRNGTASSNAPTSHRWFNF